MQVRFVARVAGIAAIANERALYDALADRDGGAVVGQVAVQRRRAIVMLNHDQVVEAGRRDLSVEMLFFNLDDEAFAGRVDGRADRHQEVVPELRRSAMAIARR